MLDFRSIFLAKYNDAGCEHLVYFFFSKIFKFTTKLSLGTIYAYQFPVLLIVSIK